MSTPVAPVFENFEVLEGVDITDKATLVGIPFGITGIRFRTNEREVVFAEVEILTADNEHWTINDSSTGVRDQCARYIGEKFGTMPEGNTDWYDVALFVPKGLRVSTYEVLVNGRPKPSKTYYLTTSGRRTESPAQAQPPRAPKARAAKPAAAA